jgi:hypothetical protein
MIRTVLAVFVTLFWVIPANAKSNRDVYPVSCDVLWTAVKNTLENPKDYGVLSVNDLQYRASFVVVGNLVMYTDRLALTERDNGCAMKLSMSQVGADNSDERGFRKRFGKALAKLQAAKPRVPSAEDEAGKPAHGQQ